MVLTLDFGAQVNANQLIHSTTADPTEIISKLRAFSNAVNQAQIGYNPFLRNSNSFAYQASEIITGRRPAAIGVIAPGSQTKLDVD